MATKDKFKVNLNNSDFVSRKIFNVEGFAGVDYQAAENMINDINAVDMLNIVYKDKVDQTRDSVEQVAKAEGKVNGVWSFIAEDNENHLIMHIDTHLYEVYGLGKDYDFLNAKFTLISELEIEDYKSYAFASGNRLYILGGNDYLILRYDNNQDTLVLESLEDNDLTYVPTTTISITYTDSAVSERSALDDVNLLTEWRKNKLLSNTYVGDGTSRTTKYYEYTLDTSIVAKSETDLNDIVLTLSQLKSREGA